MTRGILSSDVEMIYFAFDEDVAVIHRRAFWNHAPELLVDIQVRLLIMCLLILMRNQRAETTCSGACRVGIAGC